MKYFGTYKTKRAFLEDLTLTSDWFEKTSTGFNFSDDRKEIRTLLRHPLCPMSVRDVYANSPFWWQRISAMLSKYSRQEYWLKASTDPDVRVRRAAYRSATIPDVEWARIVALDAAAMKHAGFRRSVEEIQAGGSL